MWLASHQLARDIQAESGALVACGEEGFEQIALGLFQDARPLSRSSRNAAGFWVMPPTRRILRLVRVLSKCRTALSHNVDCLTQLSRSASTVVPRA